MNQRIVAIAAGSAVALVLVWYLALFSPRTAELGKQRKRLDTANGKVETLRTQLNRLLAAQQAEPIKRAKLERLRTAVPDDPGLAQFILDTNDAANRAGINFISIAPTPPAPAAASPGTASPAGAAGARPAEIKLTITISGGYSEVLDFINRVDGLSRIVVIDTLNISAGGSSQAAATSGPAPGPGATTSTTAGAQELNVTLTGRMFVSQVPAGFGAAGTQAGGAGAGAGGASTTTSTAPGATTTTTPR